MANEGSKVLVYGANGTQGAPVARRLLERGTPVRVFARSPEKAMALAQGGAEVVAADLRDKDSLVAATEGVGAVFMVLPASVAPDEFVADAKRALLATAEAGVPHLVVTTSSVVPPEPTGLAGPDSKHALSRLVDELAPDAVVLSPTLYLENFSEALRPALDGGLIPYPIPEDVPVAWVSVEDQAAFAVAALDRAELAGSRFAIGGPEALAGPELAERFGRVMGKEISYRYVPADAFAEQLVPFLGGEVARAIGEMYAYEGGPGAAALAPDTGPTLAALPVEPTPVEAWAARALR